MMPAHAPRVPAVKSFAVAIHSDCSAAGGGAMNASDDAADTAWAAACGDDDVVTLMSAVGIEEGSEGRRGEETNTRGEGGEGREREGGRAAITCRCRGWPRSSALFCEIVLQN